MLYLEFAGGLGNQMFQYATYRNLLENGKEIKCAVTNDNNGSFPFRLDIFPNVKIEFVTENDHYGDMKDKYKNRNIFQKIINKIVPNSAVVYREKEKKVFDGKIFEIDNKIISGYFQGIDYIIPVAEMLRKEFVFPYGEKKLQSMITELPKDTASIHVRRGDYLQFDKIYGGICTEEYYRKAILYMKKNGVKNWVIFSDDIEWAKNVFGILNPVFVEKSWFSHYQDWYDMCLMSACENNIIANSSFSWWGAWLNKNPNKKVVCPKKWNNIMIKNMACDDWIAI